MIRHTLPEALPLTAATLSRPRLLESSSERGLCPPNVPIAWPSRLSAAS